MALLLLLAPAPAAGENRIAAIQPNSGPTAGGTVVRLTLAGGGLVGTIEVRIGNTVPVKVRRLGLTTLEVVMPPGEPGPTAVWVINELFGTATAPVTFTYLKPTPIIEGVTPTRLSLGGSESPLRVRGTGFGPNAILMANEASLPVVTRDSEQFDARVPSSMLTSPGTLLVRVVETEPDGASSNVIQVPVVYPHPQITAVEVSPAAGPASTARITVRGTGFHPDSRIRLADDEADTRYRSGEELEATLPPTLFERSGTIPLQVVSPTPGGGTSNPWVLRLVGPPPPPPPPPIPGRYVAFTSNRGGGRNHLFLLDRRTKTLDTLEEANSVGGSDTYPSISADGRFIVFQSDRHRGQQDILLFDRETRTLDPLPEANHPSAFDGFPRISPDGRVIVFESDRLNGKPKIFVFDRETRTLSELAGANDASAEDGLATISN